MKNKKCPACKKSFDLEATAHKFGPFCSKRCQDSDLNAWFGEKYAISSSLMEGQEGEDISHLAETQEDF